MIDETVLLKKYDGDIRKIVGQYILRLQFAPRSIYSLRDDLTSEAQLAFLIKARSLQLTDYELTPLQRAMCRNAIESALRVYLWKQFNMGGYNNRSVDFSRSVTISDLLGDADIGIDDILQDSYIFDDTHMDVFSFVRRLKRIDQKLLVALMLGYNYAEIGRLLNISCVTVRLHHQKIQRKYKAYEARLRAA